MSKKGQTYEAFTNINKDRPLMFYMRMYQFKGMCYTCIIHKTNISAAEKGHSSHNFILLGAHVWSNS